MTTPTPPAAPVAHAVGPGTLKLGETGSLSDWSAQLTAASVEPSVDVDDDVDVLTGGKLSGDRTYTATLTGTVLQDTAKAGLIAWSWQHRGERVAATFTPNTAIGTKVDGFVIVDPLRIGGDVKKKNTSDFELAFTEFPTLTTLP